MILKSCGVCGVLEAGGDVGGDVHEQGAEVVAPRQALGQHLKAGSGEDYHEAQYEERRLVGQRQALGEPPFDELGHFRDACQTTER